MGFGRSQIFHNNPSNPTSCSLVQQSAGLNFCDFEEMRDIQSIGNGMGSFFAAGGERRLTPNYHQGSLKCPRCGSLNTKFCYYNNYNLSQPRFFCKGCRRYWTKGGVLRNVPVGGGSRKPKRSKQKTGNGKPSSVSVETTCERKSTGSQNSSSDSSVAAGNISPETTAFTLPQIFEPPMLNECSTDNRQLFSEIGTSRSLDELPPGFITQQRDQDEVVENQKWEMDSLGLVDHKRISEFDYSRSSNGGVAAEDWGLFDQSYWLNNPDHQLNYFL